MADEKGNNAFHYAVHNADYRVFGWLKRHDADIEHRNRQDRTPVLAVGAGSLANTACLLEHEFNATKIYANGITPLHMAAYSGHADVVKLLIQHGADVHARMHNGRYALQEALDKKQWDVVEVLLPSHIQAMFVLNRARAILRDAMHARRADIMRLLLQDEAIGKMIDRAERIAFSIEYGTPEMLKLYSALGFSLDLQYQEQTPLYGSHVNALGD